MLYTVTEVTVYFVLYEQFSTTCCKSEIIEWICFFWILDEIRNLYNSSFISSVRSSNSHPDLLVTHPLFQITPVLNTGLSLSEPLQLYKGYNAI